MDDRQVAIEHDHVVIVDEGVRQACFAIEGDVDRIRASRKPAATVSASSSSSSITSTRIDRSS
jgi:hypothetical protein